MLAAVFDLSGHVAVVTGGNSGIGLGFARGLGRAGAKLAVWGRSAEKNARAVEALQALGTEAAGYECDVSEESQVERAFAETLARFGRVDSCFANAGVSGVAPSTEMPLHEWRRVLDVNLTGVFLTFRVAAGHMAERGGGGKLVATSSMGASYGMPHHAHYSASKGAVLSLVRTFAVELARHDVQVNAVMPGWIETHMTEAARSWDKMHDAVLRRTPARRWGQPEDFEAVAVYLASPASRFHTGDILRIDGGYSLF